MTILNQSSTSKTFYIGWYGSCVQDPCVDFDLDSFADKDKIYSVFQYDIFNVGNNIFNPNLPANFNQFNSLECGKIYQIILNSGDGSIDIPNFETTNFGTLDSGRVTQSCGPTYELVDLLGYGGNLNETPLEFNSPVIQLKTTGVTAGTQIPFTIHGSNITLEDFVGLTSLQGTFIAGSDGSDGNYLLSNLNLEIAEDSTTEGPETFRISLDNHSNVYLDMTILDTSQTSHTYLLEEADGYVSVSENSPSNITTINLITTEPIGSIIPFNLSGSGITLEDFTGTIPVDANLQGNFQITGTSGDGRNFGQVTFEIAEDSTTEGPETFTIALNDHPEVFLDMTILDTSKSPPTYNLSSNLDSADEGTTVILTLETTGVDTGTPVPFTINGFHITADDFSGLDSLGAGEFIIDSNGDATFNLEIKADSTTEGPEIFTVVLDDYPNVSVDVTINDTSKSPPTYNLSSNLDSADEGTTVILTLETTGVDAGTPVPFTIHGSNITLEDFFRITPSPSADFYGITSLDAGEFIIDSNGNASFTFDIYADSVNEGPEIFTVTLNDHPDVFVDVLINDIVQTWDLTASPLQVTGDNSIELSLSTSNVEDGSYSFNITGLSQGDIDESNGSVFWDGKKYAGYFDLVNNDSSPLTLKLLNNNLSNAVLTAELDNKQDSEDVNIDNVIIPPFIPEYYLSITPETFGEGDTVEVKLFTNLPENSVVPYTIGGEVELSDFDPPLSSKTGHNFTVGLYGIATQQYTFVDDGISNSYSKTFEVTLDNVSPDVSASATLTENSVADTVKIRSGMGGTGMSNATHEGYEYKWSDIILSQSGQYSWQLTNPVNSSGLTPELLLDVKINGQSVDFSTLSGQFEISSSQENFEFEIYIRNDESDGHYIGDTLGQDFRSGDKDLRLKITYVPDGSYDFDDIKIFPQPENKLWSNSLYEGSWQINKLYYHSQEGPSRYVITKTLDPEGIRTNEVWQADFRNIKLMARGTSRHSTRVYSYGLGYVGWTSKMVPWSHNYFDLLNSNPISRDGDYFEPSYGGFNPTYTFMLKYNRMSEIALRGGDPEAEFLQSQNLEDEIYFEITQSDLVDNNHYSFIDLNSIEYIKTWNQYWFFGSSEYNTGLSEYKSNDPHYLPIQLDANGNITGFFAKNLWRKPDPSYGQWNGIGNGYAKSYVQIKFKDEYIPLLYGKQFRFRLKHPHPYMQELDTAGGKVAIDDSRWDFYPNSLIPNDGFHQCDFIWDNSPIVSGSGYLLEGVHQLVATHIELDEGEYAGHGTFTEITLINYDPDDYPIPFGSYRFKVTGEGITPDDFLGYSTHDDEYNYIPFGPSMEGIINVTENSIPSVIIATRADFRTEGTESFYVHLVDFPSISTAYTLVISIYDTSQSGPLTLTAQFPSPPIDEDGHTKILLNYDSKNLTQYDRFAFRITGEGITPDDFEYWVTGGIGEQSFGPSLEGFLEVNDQGYGLVEIKMREDSATEQAELFTVELIDYPGVTVQVTVNDTSQGTS